MWRSTMVCGLVLGMPMAAQATDLSFSWGGTVATEYVSNGVYYTDGVTLQPWVELGFGSAYAGAYIANTSGDLTGYNSEFGVSLGYRGVVGPVNYDVTLYYYMYDEAFVGFPVEDSAEFIVSAYIAATESLYVTGRVALAPEYDSTNLRLRGDYYTAVSGLSFGAEYGTSDTNYGDWEYWTVDAAYSVSDNVSVGLAYHDSTYPFANAADGLVVASINMSF